MTRRQGRLLKALEERGSIAQDDRLIHLDQHHDWEPKELDRLAQIGLIEKLNNRWRLSTEGTNFPARSVIVLARFRTRGVEVKWP